MPQQAMNEKLPDGRTVTQAVSGASTTSKTTTKTVPQEVTDAFKGFLNSIFGQNPATPVPGSAGASTAGTPGVVGGLPPNMVTPPSPLSLPAPVPVAPRPRQGLQPTAPQGYEFSNPQSGVNAGLGDLTNTLVGAIQDNKAKKDADNIARAQNTMNIFLHAVQQNDMATANLYASDPKVTGMWEKYLKQEYKRVPGKAMGSEPTPKENMASGIVPTQSTPLPPGVQGGVNEPGGIAVPQDMTPEGQIRRKQLGAIQDVMSKMDSSQIAETASMPGVNMDKAGLSPEEFKKTSLMKYGLALTKAEDAQYDTAQKVAMATTMADVMKYAVGQQSMTERAMIAAGATTSAAKIAADSRMAVAKQHVQGMKDLQNLKGTALQTALYQQQMKTYQQLADDLQKKLADPNYGKGWFSDSDREAMVKERDDYVKKLEGVRQEFDGFKLMQQFFPELNGEAGAESDTVKMNPEPEAQ